MNSLITQFVDEGNTSYHPYILYTLSTDSTDEGRISIDGEWYKPMTVVETLKYKVSDDSQTLVDWQTISNFGTGTIIIPGIINRITNPNMLVRYITLLAVHDSGKHLTKEISYMINPMIGIDENTEPLI